MRKNFFKDLQGFYLFSEACDSKHYYPAPSDWFVVVTDVEGSTKAIEQGRYKDVNMIGVACITAVVNVCKGMDVPYVFGGDGATFLLPPENIEDVKKELMAVKKQAQAMHNLSLRVGVVPVEEITKQGKEFAVARYIMKTGCALAMFSGGGAAVADDLVKNAGFEVKDDKEGGAPPNLSGLSCRWQPIKAKNGVVLTLLAMSTGQSSGAHHEINNFIEQTVGSEATPVNEENLVYKWPTKKTLHEASMVWRQGSILLNCLGHIFIISLFNIMDRFKMSVGKLNVPAYKQDMIANSDYRKFDDMLRMVVDCSKQQAEVIEGYLEDMHSQGRVVYGTHYSDSALMTCFVPSLESDGHVHFIDGSDGGYAVAAKQLKAQLGAMKTSDKESQKAS